jgi:GTP cyclohydrolase II
MLDLSVVGNKIAALRKAGITVVEHIPLIVNRNAFNAHYLHTKATKLDHLIPILFEVENVARIL